MTQSLGSTRGVARDPRRDFPYNTQPESCLNTVAARTLYRLFADNVIVSALTFSSGRGPVVAYPWGSYNHRRQVGDGYVSKEAPDFLAFEALAEAMVEKAGGEISFAASGLKLD